MSRYNGKRDSGYGWENFRVPTSHIFLIVQTVLRLFRSVVLVLTLNIVIEPSVGFYYLYLFRRQFQTWHFTT